MITPGTTADWFMAAGLLGAVVAFGAGGYRWMLRDVDRAASDGRSRSCALGTCRGDAGRRSGDARGS